MENLHIDTGIKKILEKLKIDRNRMADDLNVHKNTIGRYIRNEKLPSAEMLYKIHKIYGININWLLSGRGAMFDYSSITELPVVMEKNIEYHNEGEGYLSITEMDSVNRLMKVMKRRKSVGRIVATLVEVNEEERGT